VGDATYPTQEEILSGIETRAGKVITIDGLSIAERAGELRAINTVVLGALSALLDTPPEAWEEAIVRRVPPRYADVNRIAFKMGREAATVT
jgi:indolepyruvate ferredoxin oxidoreductase beta subunit